MAMLSDNIANVNTNGYKLAAPRFSTLVTTASSNTFYTSGGAQSNIAREIDSQGLLQGSSTATDIAVSGAGFFTVTDAVALNTATNDWEIDGSIFYTRAGEFRADKDGNLVNSAGFFLTGWERNATDTGYDATNVQSAFSAINVASQSASPVPSQNISFSANLNSDAATGDTFNTPVQVFDRKGGQKTLTLVYTKNAAANTWDIGALIDVGTFIDPDTNDDGTVAGDDGGITGTNTASDDIIGNEEVTDENADWGDAGAGTTTVPVSVGTIVFNADGSLASVDGGNGNTSIGMNGNAADGQLQILIDHNGVIGTAGTEADDAVALNIDFGTIGGTDGFTEFSGSSVLNTFAQDGKQFGSLTGVAVNEFGEVTALFDNGDSRLLYQVPVTTFNNPNGLQTKTGNVFLETDASGAAISHISGEGGAGSITPNAIESSTVDLANEFTNMITTQRAYSASTKIITTADEMLDELIRTKR